MNSPKIKPRLLIPATTFPRWQDDPGPAPFVLHHARALAAHFDVTVLAPHHAGAARDETIGPLRVKRFPYAPDRLELLCDGAGIQNNMRKSIAHRALVLPLLAAEYAALRRELRQGEYDYVNSHWIIPSGFLAALAAPAPIKHIITVHAADHDLILKLPAGRRILDFTARRAHRIAAVSPRFLPELERAAPGRVVLQPMGVELARFRAEASTRPRPGSEATVLFVGKLSPKKGVDVLLSAAAQLKASGLTLKVTIVGEGELKSGLLRLSAELGLDNVVSFMGAVPNRELPGLYAAAGVVAVPSVRDPAGETEGMPVVVLEALAAGTPVVATRLCSVPEALIGRGVIEIPEGDPAALEAGLRSALAGESRVDPAALAPFDTAAVAERYAALFAEAAG